jgi:UDP-GlcNAc:undecaprenyl-phosphate/decaprenyl-phosphate GlcNAc-1-phosphate transferase
MWAALVAFGTVLISLYPDEAWMWASLAGMAVLTVAMTFVLPKLHAPPPVPPMVPEDA